MSENDIAPMKRTHTVTTREAQTISVDLCRDGKKIHVEVDAEARVVAVSRDDSPSVEYELVHVKTDGNGVKWYGYPPEVNAILHGCRTLNCGCPTSHLYGVEQ